MTGRRVDRFPSDGPGPALWHWDRHLNPLRVAFHWLVVSLSRVSPSLALKVRLWRLLGAKVGERVAIGLDVMLDVFHPYLVEIGDDVTIGYDSTLLCHEYLRGERRTGRISIETGATVGANCTILPGVRIGKGAVVSAMSLVNRDVPPGEFWGGVPIRKLRDAAEGSVREAT